MPLMVTFADFLVSPVLNKGTGLDFLDRPLPGASGRHRVLLNAADLDLVMVKFTSGRGIFGAPGKDRED